MAVPYHQLQGFISRRRVTEVLRHGSRVVLLRAGGGFGKTTAVSDWVAAEGSEPVLAWITADQHTRSQRSFWYRAVEVLQAVGHASGPLERYLAGRVDVALVPGLIVDLVNSSSSMFQRRLVVDDLHLLSVEAQRDLVWVLEHAPGLGLVGVSRSRSVFEEPMVSGRFGAEVLDEADLALTLDELAELGRSCGVQASVADLERLLELSRGNVLVSRLALHALRFGTRPGTSLVTEAVDEVVSSLTETLLPHFRDPDDERVALLLSVLPEFDAELIGRVVDGVNGEAQLQRFVFQGAGSHFGGPRRLFRFHGLVRSALEKQAARQLDPSVLNAVRLRGAEFLAGRGDPVEVVKLLLEAGEPERVWPFVASAFSVLTVHRVDDLLALLADVPDDVYDRCASLAVVYAIMLSEREARPSPRVKRLCDAAIELFDHADLDRLSVSEKALMLIARFAALRASRRYDLAADAGRDVLSFFGSLTSQAWGELGLAGFTSTLQIVITDFLAGRLDDVASHSSLLNGDQDRGRGLHLKSVVTLSEAVRGNFPRVQQCLAEFPAELDTTWPTSLHAVGWNLARAASAVEAGAVRDAYMALEPLEHRAGRFEYWPVLLWIRGLIRIVDADAVRGRDEFRAALREHEGRAASSAWYGRVIARYSTLMHATHDSVASWRILETAPPVAEVLLARARLLLDSGKAAQALSVAESIRSFPTHRQKADTLVVLAIANGLLQLPGEARKYAEQATLLMSRFQLTTPSVVLRAVAQGDMAEVAEQLGLLNRPLSGHKLSAREREVLLYLRSAAERGLIAESLHISTNTVKTHVASIYRKLGVASREDAVAAARCAGLL